AALRGRAEAHQVELARLLDPRRAMHRTLLAGAPPEPHVALARVEPRRVRAVEGEERGIALRRRMRIVVGCHRDHPSSGRKLRDSTLPLLAKRAVTKS